MSNKSLLRSILLLLLGGTTLCGHAKDDFGLWTEAGIDKKLGKQFTLSAGMGFRTNNDMQNVDRWDISIGLDYKILPCLKLGISYMYMYGRSYTEWKRNYKDDIEDYAHWRGYNATRPYWRSKNRLNVMATGYLKLGRFTFSLRERYQLTGYNHVWTIKEKYRFNDTENKNDLEWRESEPDLKKAKSKNYLRSRLQIEYDIRKCKLTPFASFELTNNLEQAFRSEEYRIRVGGEYRLTKKHRVSLAYVFEDSQDNWVNNIHVIDIGYKFKF